MDMKKWCILVAMVFLCMGLCACGGSNAASATEAIVAPTYSAEELAYNEAMAAYFKTMDPSEVTGDKAVVCIHDPEDYEKCFYSSQYLPEELIAESPEDVCYIIHLYESVINTGWYTSGGKAYKYYLHATLEDPKYETPIVSTDIVSIPGGDPPEEVSEPGDHYGSRPAFEELGAVVMETVMEKIAEYEEKLSEKLCANCGIQLKDQYVCCPECGTFR